MKRNAGFGVVGIVLVVAAVAVLGLIGWRLYDANNAKQDNSNNQSSNTQGNNSSNGSQADTATYLDIKELGIKLKLSDDIKDATYYYDTSTSTPVARVSTQSLTEKSHGSCDPKTNAPFGTIKKTQSLTLPNGVTLEVDNVSVFQFGNDYIVYSTPNQPCSTDTTVSDLQTAQLASFKQAVKTMQLNR